MIITPPRTGKPDAVKNRFASSEYAPAEKLAADVMRGVIEKERLDGRTWNANAGMDER